MDLFNTHTPGLDSPPARAYPISPDDGAELDVATRGIMVTSAGNVAVLTIAGDTATLPGLEPGVQYAIRAKKILATGTTASGIVGLA